jgi:hypothetical protein
MKLKLHNVSDLQNPPYATFEMSMCSIPPPQCCQPPPFMPASIRPTLQYMLLQKNENDYSELFIPVLAHLLPINLNINCYYGIKIIETIK